MLRNLIIVAAALATPALAQSDTPKKSQSEAVKPQSDAPKADAPAAEADLAAAVAADWPRFDHGGKGHLVQEEFVTWLTTLRAQSAPAGEDAARVRSWADASFAKADANTDKRVTPEEFTSFLQSKVNK